MLPEPADRVAFYPALHPSDPVIDGAAFPTASPRQNQPRKEYQHHGRHEHREMEPAPPARHQLLRPHQRRAEAERVAEGRNLIEQTVAYDATVACTFLNLLDRRDVAHLKGAATIQTHLISAFFHHAGEPRPAQEHLDAGSLTLDDIRTNAIKFLLSLHEQYMDPATPTNRNWSTSPTSRA